MVQAWYDKGVFLYLMAGVCGIGVLFKVILGWYLSRMVRNTEKMQKTRKKWLLRMQQDFQACAKECGKVHNVDIFVDKYVGNRRFLGVMLSTWDKFGGQTALLCAGIAVVAAAAGIFYQVDREVVLFTFFVGIWLVIINMVVDNLASLPEKREQATTNLKDYFMNWMAVPVPLAEEEAAYGMEFRPSDGAAQELALAQVTENELEALLGGAAQMQEEESHPARLYVIHSGQENGQPFRQEKTGAQVKSLSDEKEVRTAKESHREAAKEKRGETVKESHREAVARKKREKMVRQAMARQEKKDEAEEQERLRREQEKFQEEQEAMAYQQIAAAKEENEEEEEEEIEDIVLEPEKDAKEPENGRLIEEVLREFLV